MEATADALLVTAARGGDVAAYGELFARYHFSEYLRRSESQGCRGSIGAVEWQVGIIARWRPGSRGHTLHGCRLH